MDYVHILMHVALGISLAACAGLRAFLPLLVIGVLVRLSGADHQYIQVVDNFKWIGSNFALIAFGVATLVEIMGDKFPAVDHFLDSAGVVIKPIAGTILFASVVVKMDPILAVILGIIAGGTISEVIHVKKAGLRLASSSLTGGIANPVLSIFEDLGAGIGIALSIIVPVLAAFIIILGIYLGYRTYSGYIKNRKEKMRKREMEKAGKEGKNIKKEGSVEGFVY